jgi:23S rRNA pseudoU1915 N3-methylase RlmH
MTYSRMTIHHYDEDALSKKKPRTKEVKKNSTMVVMGTAHRHGRRKTVAGKQKKISFSSLYFPHDVHAMR